MFSQIRADLATCGVDEPAFGLANLKALSSLGLMVYIDLRARAIFDSGQDLLQAFELREQQALGEHGKVINICKVRYIGNELPI